MEIGIGLDQTLRLDWAQQRELVREAAELGYTSAWSPSSATGRDAFQICAQWWAASAAAVEGGVTTGISVVPAPVWSVPPLASAAATVGDLTGGRFILGVGMSAIYTEAFLRTYGLPARPPIAVMRDYLVTLRQLLAGERLDHEGKTLTLHDLQMAFRPPKVPVYLAALGPQMLRLAGEAADGVALNWCSAEQVAWSRERIAEGVGRAGRGGADVRVVEYIRICVDEDQEVARRALARATLGYALARPGASKAHGYRGHFGRMGFEKVLTELEVRRDAGAPEDELVEAFPRDLLRQVGYYGAPEGAAAAFERLAEGLDVAIVRVVPARPGAAAVRAVMHACAPAPVRAAGVPADRA